MSNPSNWTSHLEKWPQNHSVGPICVHAEGDTTANIILMAKRRPLHICHVARKSELGMYFPNFLSRNYFWNTTFFAEIIKAAKNIGLPITCEVCPHHLFLTEQHLENNFLAYEIMILHATKMSSSFSFVLLYIKSCGIVNASLQLAALLSKSVTVMGCHFAWHGLLDHPH